MPLSLPLLVWLFLIISLIAWTLLPSVLFPNLPLDVNEGLLWGQTWQWGYYKHPPLQAWLLQTTYEIAGTQRWAYFLLAQLIISIAILGVYATARRLAQPNQAALATLALSGIYYFNVTSIEFNPNTLQLATWAWASYFFVTALQTHTWRAWLALGAMLALATYSKYFSIILSMSFILFMLFEPAARRQLATYKPWAALLFCLLLLLPHLLWLVQHDYLPFSYALERGQAEARHALSQHVLAPFKFTLAQCGALLFAFILLLSAGIRWKPTRALKLDLIFILAWGPLALTLCISLITGMQLRDMWGTPLLSFIPLYFVVHHAPQTWHLRRFTLALAVVFVFFLSALTAAQLSGKAFSRLNFQGQTLADTWQSRWPYAKPPYAIIASHWLGGNASFYSPSRPLVFIEADRQKSPWIQLDKLSAQGAVIMSEQRAQAQQWLSPYSLNIDWQEPIVLDSSTIQLGWITPTTTR